MLLDLYQLIQILYWLALATWFGGLLFVAVAAPVIFRTIRENNPVLPHVLSVNLEGQHGTLLAGSIVANILSRLSLVQVACAGFLLIVLIAQLFLIDLEGSNLTAAILRCAMYVGAVSIVLFDWWVVWPRVQRFRNEYVEHADEPEIANPAKDEFDREHRRSLTMMLVQLFLLLGMIVFSANVSPRGDVVRAVHAEAPAAGGGR